MPQSKLEDVQSAVLRTIEYLTADAIGDEASAVRAFAEPLSQAEARAQLEAGVILCRGLVHRVARLEGVDPTHVLRGLAVEALADPLGA